MRDSESRTYIIIPGSRYRVIRIDHLLRAPWWAWLIVPGLVLVALALVYYLFGGS